MESHSISHFFKKLHKDWFMVLVFFSFVFQTRRSQDNQFPASKHNYIELDLVHCTDLIVHFIALTWCLCARCSDICPHGM